MITITSAAERRVTEILTEERAPALRIFVQGGGCSGFSYGFTLERDEATEDDTVIQVGSLKVLVDAMSLMYLDGANIDYKEELLGSRFVLDNPNVSATCGCGSSFAVS
jgi:iron-sulfur cluster insertion protein